MGGHVPPHPPRLPHTSRPAAARDTPGRPRRSGGTVAYICMAVAPGGRKPGEMSPNCVQTVCFRHDCPKNACKTAQSHIIPIMWRVFGRKPGRKTPGPVVCRCLYIRKMQLARRGIKITPKTRRKQTPQGFGLFSLGFGCFNPHNLWHKALFFKIKSYKA